MLSKLSVSVHVLGLIQMFVTALIGGVKVYSDSGPPSGAAPDPAARPQGSLLRTLAIVGMLRGCSVIMGLVSLSLVSVSFVETVKASAPLFTVAFAWCLLQEKTSTAVIISLFPVMGGLVLCAATELSFTTMGFLAAVGTNCLDCINNVYSKKLMLQDPSMTPERLQFYTSSAALLLQFPLACFNIIQDSNTGPEAEGSGGHPWHYYMLNPIGAMDVAYDAEATEKVFRLIALNVVFYYVQSITAYNTMSLISPVSQSVANTMKRSILIFLSIWFFENAVTSQNAMGMLTVIFGVCLYSWVNTYYPQQKVAATPTTTTSAIEMENTGRQTGKADGDGGRTEKYNDNGHLSV